MGPDYFHEGINKKDGTDSEYFTSPSSTAIYPVLFDKGESEEEEFFPTLNKFCAGDSVHEPCCSDESSSKDDTDADLDQPLDHLSR